MDRRGFLGAAAGSAAMLSAGCRPAALGRGARMTDASAWSGAPLQKRAQLYRHYLFDDFLPFHYEHVVDGEYGGFMCSVDRDGTRVADTKSAWYEGRGAWTFAYLYNHVDPDPRHLETARRSVELILRTRPDEEHFWPRSLSREGEPLQPPQEPRHNDLYGDCFLAAGIAEAARALGRDEWREVARQILRKCVRIYDRDDFCPDDRSWLGDEAPPITGMRTISAWMLFLWVGQALLEGGPGNSVGDDEVEAIVTRSIEAVLDSHYNEEIGLINEVVGHDMQRAGGAYDQFVAPATVNETLWMVLGHAVRRGDAALLERSATQLRRHLEFGWDYVYGGVYMNCHSVEDNRWDHHRKGLWAQVETLNALQLLVEHTDLGWAHEWYARLSAYVLEKWPADQYGAPLWLDYTDRKVTFEPHWTRADVLHYPRHLMHTIRSMERLQAASDRPLLSVSFPGEGAGP